MGNFDWSRHGCVSNWARNRPAISSYYFRQPAQSMIPLHQSRKMPAKRTSSYYKPAKRSSRNTRQRLADTCLSDPTPSQNPVDIKCEAKKFFHRSYHGRTVGRIEQKATIAAYLDGPFGLKGLYIAGHPGTGKTAVMTELLMERDEKTHFMVNCIMMGSVKAVTNSITKHFKVARMEDLGKVTIILDEVDFLAEKDLNFVTLLYSRSADLKVIGIANTLDLAITKLPNYTQPVSFPPYSVQDITAIIANRLEIANKELQLESVKLLDPLAIELCARKVATTGDLRKALEIIQLAIEAAPAPTATSTVLIDLPVLLKTMEKLMPATTQNTLSKVSKSLEQCNLHQKLIIIALLLLRKEKLEARPTLMTVMQEYLRITTVGKLGDALSRSDFLDAIANLESLGVTRMLKAPGSTGASNHNNNASGKAMDRWSCKVSVEADPGELNQCMTTGNPLLAALIK